jgi:hypothetical protein
MSQLSLLFNDILEVLKPQKQKPTLRELGIMSSARRLICGLSDVLDSPGSPDKLTEFRH